MDPDFLQFLKNDIADGVQSGWVQEKLDNPRGFKIATTCNSLLTNEILPMMGFKIKNNLKGSFTALDMADLACTRLNYMTDILSPEGEQECKDEIVKYALFAQLLYKERFDCVVGDDPSDAIIQTLFSRDKPLIYPFLSDKSMYQMDKTYAEIIRDYTKLNTKEDVPGVKKPKMDDDKLLNTSFFDPNIVKKPTQDDLLNTSFDEFFNFIKK
jgi:hypothetical protein